jgi:uncharacterized spore protein YtfJ
MGKEFDEIVVTTVKSQEQAAELVEKLFAVAQPGAVFSGPVTVGEHTLITASEVNVGMGFGYGVGSRAGFKPVEDETAGEESQDESGGDGFGSGGGGGGVSGGRPVAVINIGPEGVRVEPVVDATKIALAFFTTLGSMLFMLSKMRRAGRGKS